MESIWAGPWNPYGMVYSMDNPYGFHSGYGLKKWLGTQPKNSSYGIHGLGVGIHPVHMESIWNHPGSVKTSPRGTNFELDILFVIWPPYLTAAFLPLLLQFERSACALFEK